MFLYRKTLKIPSHYTLYGERHSGTKFFDNIIKTVFHLKKNNHYGHKHFFGFANHRQISIDDQSIFFCIIRNPYDWLAAMNSLPHHAPNHLCPLIDHIFEEWYSISQYWKPWETKPVNIVNNEIMEDRHLSIDRRYKNILELRNTKNNYLLKILPLYTQNIVILTYEELINNYIATINIISKSFLIPIYNNNITIVPSKKRFLPDNIIKQINPHLDWSTETMLGYTKL